MTGPNPVDRGKSNSKITSDPTGPGCFCRWRSAAGVNDSYALEPLVMAIPAIRSRRGLQCPPRCVGAERASGGSTETVDAPATTTGA